MSIIHELSRTLPKGNVLTGEENTRPFECDGLSVYRQKPLAVVLPQSVEQIKQVLKICKAYNTPVVTRGAGTGLSGGAMPLEESVVLGLSKLNKIKFIDEKKRLAVLEPGVRNIAISEAVAEFGLYYAPDPSSQIACTIGGNVAENSGGVHCLKYGLTVHNVEAIKMLTIDGEELILSRQDEGLGLLALMNGSEGLLGIVTEITVKLTPIPELARVVMAGFDSVRDCANAVADIIKAGIIPAGLEMMDSFAIEAAEGFANVGYPLEAQALLLCELDGTKAQVQAELDCVLKVLSGASTLKVSQSEAERLNLWKGRKSAFPAVGRLSPDYYCMDGTIPRRHLADMLEKINELSQKYQLRVANVFHAGDGNLHPLILYDANVAGELEKTEEFGTEILKLSVDMGGTITGEHGVGVEKLNAMCHQFNAKELEIFHKIKQAFDENELLNPGKAVPELHRCAELGAMHVHHGKLPHPELERF
ncbi:Glycolate dehydrogenase (EC, subunit GlcD [uncultured Gammaproteobacteria bacterium]|jgi:glycolate oxidase|uniref:FAD-linked oxidase C-terminal domain-containing protein n=1 Tax=thiotrophic endosymbiont of Bathymodiolus puteoserpentis (Logatchev) TaxID=343240 RepID=UPI0010B4CB2C|nr:FAD-linked oxidase C-terminal domain-containing protein [thiotrophic endosymbiont of Bathymodiolus puteoserpentis (Logatchev)]CAC9574800.1 Glycolate dehydrogenase (EC 1.1.99.14), subunit GlcD [uncultured Gammaproteobacteria bacterium]CAC9980660.1 Glycolate dehydrogenase (EC 1.1.99.14), subunit GlcD [uncultured Gammaproteobacteria bacterium]SSC10569.1 Glycolate dehydrogenase, subunit GlcD [thiotrophic endosymbiont of Bathymodiolus puteoserpentis (Logatchev)]VVH51760.1 Glycolate dehydrogenase 